jgi:hypothetical protein
MRSVHENAGKKSGAKMTSRRVTERAKIEQKFSKVVEALSRERGITIGAGKGFGSGALKVDGKIFAMLASGNQFVVKVSKDRVDALVTANVGKRFEPRPGRLMKEWLVVQSKRADWIALAKEACEVVKRGEL